jgi:hypothetical protein
MLVLGIWSFLDVWESFEMRLLKNQTARIVTAN